MTFKELTPEMQEYFHRFYNLRIKRDFCKMFENQFGQNLKLSSADYYARKLGLTGERPANWMTVQDICVATGKSQRYIKQCIRRGRLKAVKPGRQWLVAFDEADRFIDLQNDLQLPPPWRWITTGDASAILGMIRTTLNQVAMRGCLPSKKIIVNGQQQIVVPMAIIEAGIRKMKNTGHTKVRWEKLTQEWDGR
jgi:excisionase family DNA binding protein